MHLLQRTFQLTAASRVLDVGGSPDIWELLSVQPDITIVNFPTALQGNASFHRVGGDGCLLPFRKGEFDLVFSNSVIEHVGAAEKQQQFAREVMRVGRNYWVQTPNRHFPFEQHLWMPLLHLLPKDWREPLTRFGTGWELLTRPSQPQRDYYLRHCLDEVNLLSVRDLRRLFPDANLLRERLLGYPKSLIAIRKQSV